MELSRDEATKQKTSKGFGRCRTRGGGLGVTEDVRSQRGEGGREVDPEENGQLLRKIASANSPALPVAVKGKERKTRDRGGLSKQNKGKPGRRKKGEIP